MFPVLNATKQPVARLVRLDQGGLYLTRADRPPSLWLGDAWGDTGGSREDASGQRGSPVKQLLCGTRNTLIAYTTLFWLLYNTHYIIQTKCDNEIDIWVAALSKNAHTVLRTGRGNRYTLELAPPARSTHFITLSGTFFFLFFIPLNFFFFFFLKQTLRWIQHDMLVMQQAASSKAMHREQSSCEKHGARTVFFSKVFFKWYI